MNIYSVISSNKRKTWLIIILFIAFIATVAFIYGKAQGDEWIYTGIALLLATASAFFSYFYSDKLVLASTQAHEIQKDDNPELYRVIENLCIGSGQPMPRVSIMNEPAPNAFATGRDPKHAVVCVTTGLLEKLTRTELEGVIAHELSHIQNYDIRVMTLSAILVGSVALLGDIFLRSMWYGGNRRGKGGNIILLVGIVFAILSPVIATLLQLAISRKREFLADASGALLTRYPDGLASALEKISHDHHKMHAATNATAHLFISNPFKNKSTGHWFATWFNTHPPLEERIKILRAM